MVDGMKLGTPAVLLLMLTACFMQSAEVHDDRAKGLSIDEAPAAQVDTGMANRKPMIRAAKKARSGRGKESAASAQSSRAIVSGSAARAESEKASSRMAEEAKRAPNNDAPEEAAVRTWFPDAFLWEPMIETDENGFATVPVRVPDTLTDWRVLGLAHDRTGQQAGAVTTFASMLPLSADPRLPSYLYVGDVLEMPLRATNNTDRAVSASVAWEATGALRGSGRSSLRIGPRGVGTKRFTMRAVERGDAVVRTRLQGAGEVDRTERSVRVTPLGRPVESFMKGTLEASTPLSPPALEGIEGGESLDVVVFPGPLALVSAEVDRYTAGARPALPGAAFQAIQHLRALSEKTGTPIDERAIRRLELLAWQQVSRARGGDWTEAVRWLRAVSPVDLIGGVESARPAMNQKVARAQKPDGTWSSQRRSTLQRVLVETATAAMVLPEGSPARLKAEGAIERQLPNIQDSYTAAVLLGSGVLKGTAAEPARTLLREAIEHDDQGVPSISVPTDIRDAWGDVPSGTATLAWTVLALVDDDKAADDRGKLAAQLISSWSRGNGFGAGAADPIALLAVVQAVPGASGPTTVSLWANDQQLAAGTIDPSKPGIPLVLTAGVGAAEVRLDPPVSGLAYAATRRGYAPWPTAQRIPGLEWEWVEPKTPLRVGETGEVALRFAAPRDAVLNIELGLPAGINVDAKTLRADPALAHVLVLDDRVKLRTHPIPSTGSIVVTLPVTPAFAGTFGTVPMRLEVRGQPGIAVPAHRWTIALN